MHLSRAPNLEGVRDVVSVTLSGVHSGCSNASLHRYILELKMNVSKVTDVSTQSTH